MHCQIKVDFKADDLELVIEGEFIASWRANNVIENNSQSPRVLSSTNKYIDLNVVRQMCNEAYRAGGKNSITKLDKIEQILKG